MSMKINDSMFGNYTSKTGKSSGRKSVVSKKTENSREAGGVKGQKLSKAAQNVLKKLRSTYGDKMDFTVVNEGQDANDMLAHSTTNKEYAVFISADDLEKMAKDKNYEKEYTSKMLGAAALSDEVAEKFGEDSDVSKVGVSFGGDSDEMSLFAQLEKSLDPLNINPLAEGYSQNMKTAFLEANSIDDLISKVNDIDWTQVHEQWKTSGMKFDMQV